MTGVMVIGGSRGMTGAPMFVEPRGDARRCRHRVVRPARRRSGAAGIRLGGDHPCVAGDLRRRTRADRSRRGARRHLALPRPRARPRSRSGNRDATRPCSRSSPRRACRSCSTPTASTRSTAISCHCARARPSARPPCSLPTTASTRVSPDSRSATIGSRAARRLADRSLCVVLLKGPGTVIAEPAIDGRPGRLALNDTGSAALATAGSGDRPHGSDRGLPRPWRPRLRGRRLRRVGARSCGANGRPSRWATPAWSRVTSSPRSHLLCLDLALQNPAQEQ